MDSDTHQVTLGCDNCATAFATHHSIDERRRLVDARILDLTSAIFQLKTQRNELAPISKLPPEILASIFYLASPYSNGHFFNPKSCFNFAYVSRRWRSVALDTPRLWTVLPLRHRKWTEVMMERSRMAGLVMEKDLRSYIETYSIRKPVLNRMKQIIMDYPNRIEEIRLPGIFATELEAFLDGIPDSSLRLTSLVLTTDNINHHAIPINIIAEAQRLRQLHIGGFHFPWYSQSFCGLTHLQVEKSPDRPPMSSIIRALRSMPALQVLYLDDALPSCHDISYVEPVSLLNLQRLHLQSSTNLEDVSNILSIIVVPVEAIIDLVCTEGKNDVVRFANSLSTFFSSMHSRESEQPSYRDLRLSSSFRDGFFRISLFQRADNIADVRLDFRFQNHSTLEKVLSSIPLQHLSSLSLSRPLRGEGLMEVFGNLKQLQMIDVTGNCLVGLVEAMRMVDRTPVYPLFPGLHTLVIREAIFTSEELGCVDPNTLENCLAERYNHNAKLRKLKFCYCSVYDFEVQSLLRFVDDVEVIGRRPSK